MVQIGTTLDCIYAPMHIICVLTMPLQAVAGFFGYFVVMGQNGFLPHTLIGLRKSWDNPDVMVQDSYGQDWV